MRPADAKTYHHLIHEPNSLVNYSTRSHSYCPAILNPALSSHNVVVRDVHHNCHQQEPIHQHTLLTYINYDAWKDTMIHVLRAVDADNIITDEAAELPPTILITETIRSALLRPLVSSHFSAHLKYDHTSKAYRPQGNYHRLRRSADCLAVS